MTTRARKPAIPATLLALAAERRGYRMIARAASRLKGYDTSRNGTLSRYGFTDLARDIEVVQRTCAAHAAWKAKQRRDQNE